MLNVILQSLIFVGILSSDIAAKIRSLMGLLEASLWSTKIWCVSTSFSWVFSRIWQCELVRSEAALIRSNQCFDKWLQSFTQYACKDFICDREKPYIPVVGTYRRASLFWDRTENIAVSIIWHTFLLLFASRRSTSYH